MKFRPISCDLVIEKSVPWLEGELSPSEMEQISEHLEHCPNCAELFERLDHMELEPPALRLETGENYWAKMDNVLSEEMDRRWEKSTPGIRPWQIYALAASFLFSLIWGYAEYRRAEQLQGIVETQLLQLERLQRTYAHPRNPQAEPYVLPAAHIPNRMEL